MSKPPNFLLRSKVERSYPNNQQSARAHKRQSLASKTAVEEKEWLTEKEKSKVESILQQYPMEIE